MLNLSDINNHPMHKSKKIRFLGRVLYKRLCDQHTIVLHSQYFCYFNCYNAIHPFTFLSTHHFNVVSVLLGVCLYHNNTTSFHIHAMKAIVKSNLAPNHSQSALTTTTSSFHKQQKDQYSP